MKKETKKNFGITISWSLVFIAWTIAICTFDLKGIGPTGSVVGFASINGFFHDLTGVHMSLYTITDYLGLVPLCIVFGFGMLGLVQLIKRRRFLKVDSDLLVLGGFYVLVLGAYLLFEILAINYRPVLIEGALEASYPSSTTLLTMCVMPTAIMQLNERIQNEGRRKLLSYLILAFTIFMVGSRLLSGVHWLTDIVGGAFLSISLILLYRTVNAFVSVKLDTENTLVHTHASTI